VSISAASETAVAASAEAKATEKTTSSSKAGA
jgi:hypothetical protein